ncbi:EIF4B family protein [Megaselia abdita]
MSSGKNKKKNKGKVLSLQSFLSNGNETPIGVTQVTKKVRDSDDEDALPQIYQLPTAPRSTRLFDDVPHNPPFLAHMSNLPFDIKEDDIYEFFGVPLISLRLPREEGETGRIRGFGHIEFETRDDLIQAISLPDPHIKNRRVRIDIPNENEQKRNYNRNNRYEGGSGFGGSNDNRESSNWRRDNDNNRDDNRRTGGYNKSNYNRAPREGSPEGGSWRTGNRPNLDASSQTRPNSDRYSNRSQVSFEVSAERPKLNLAPRTLPLPEIVTKPEEEGHNTPVPEISQRPPKVSAEQIFGSAKPVDTAAKEKEVEDKLEKEKELQGQKDKPENDKDRLTDNENNMSEKVADIHINKDDNRNNWRRRDDVDCQISRNNSQKRNGDRKNEKDRRGHERSSALDKNK